MKLLLDETIAMSDPIGFRPISPIPSTLGIFQGCSPPDKRTVPLNMLNINSDLDKINIEEIGRCTSTNSQRNDCKNIEVSQNEVNPDTKQAVKRDKLMSKNNKSEDTVIQNSENISESRKIPQILLSFPSTSDTQGVDHEESGYAAKLSKECETSDNGISRRQSFRRSISLRRSIFKKSKKNKSSDELEYDGNNNLRRSASDSEKHKKHKKGVFRRLSARLRNRNYDSAPHSPADSGIEDHSDTDMSATVSTTITFSYKKVKKMSHCLFVCLVLDTIS